MVSNELAKVFALTGIAFAVALFSTPLLTAFLYRHRLGKQIRAGGDTPVFTQLHQAKAGTPTMAGVLVWGTTVFLALAVWLLGQGFGFAWAERLDFLNRRETWLPLGALLGASLVGLADDFMDVRRLGHNGRGIRFRHKVFLYLIVAAIGAWWFYDKLGFSTVHVPFYGQMNLGLWYVPLFIFVTIGTSFSVNETDGLDGLAGGCLLFALFAFGLIAYTQGRENLAALLGVVCGGLLAFLWFNVHPARFIMGDTGSMGLGVLLASVAFLTNSVLLLPIIGSVFVLETLSVILQLSWRTLFKRKLLRSAPVHHHLEALGWPESKITARAWIIAAVSALVGVVIYFVG